jgi:hypothetical protein
MEVVYAPTASPRLGGNLGADPEARREKAILWAITGGNQHPRNLILWLITLEDSADLEASAETRSLRRGKWSPPAAGTSAVGASRARI